MTNMVDFLTVVAEMKAKPGKEETLRKLLRGLVAPTRQEPGCVQYDLHESIEEPGFFLFYEKWKSREDLDLHFETPHIGVLIAQEAELVEGEARIYLLKRIDREMPAQG